METEYQIRGRSLAKFLAAALVGVTAFLLPIQYQGSMNTVVGALTDLIETFLGTWLDKLLLVMVVASAAGSIADKIQTTRKQPLPARLHELFEVSWLGLAAKLAALVFGVMCYFQVGPDFIIGPDVGQNVIPMMRTVLALAIGMSFLLPFLTESGLMEFAGELTRSFVRPLFKVPSDASLDLIASWMGAANAAVILSAEKYKKGFYTKREAAIVMCNFSLVSVPFCMVIASTANIKEYFPVMYALLCVLGVILAVILPRIWPLSSLKDEYFDQGRPQEQYDKSVGVFRRAFRRSTQVAEGFTWKTVLKSGSGVMCSMFFSLLPVAMVWSALGMIIVAYTPILDVLSLPMGWLMSLMGIEEAAAAAPATLVGFIDMFIPSVLVSGLASVRTRFIIATLSLIQIIYIAEVGAVILQTKLGIDFKRLFVIFLERTIISLPLIVVASNFIF